MTLLQSKTLLPIRAEHCLIRGFPQVVLHYPEIVRGHTVERTLVVGPPPGEEGNFYRDPLGVAVLDVMRAFWEEEKKNEHLRGDLDRVNEEKRLLEGDVKEMQAKINDLKKQLRALEDKKTAKGG